MRYSHKTKWVRTIDGDSVEFLIDQGLKVFSKQTVRLARINTPELNSKDPEEKKRAEAARDFVDKWCMSKDGYFTLDIKGADPYGRWIAEIIYQTENLSDVLLATGLAEPYPKVQK